MAFVRDEYEWVPGETKGQNLSLTQARPKRVSGLLNAGHCSKEKSIGWWWGGGQHQCQVRLHLAPPTCHTEPCCGWSLHLRKATGHGKEEGKGFLLLAGSASFSGAEAVSEVTMGMH